MPTKRLPHLFPDSIFRIKTKEQVLSLLVALDYLPADRQDLVGLEILGPGPAPKPESYGHADTRIVFNCADWPVAGLIHMPWSEQHHVVGVTRQFLWDPPETWYVNLKSGEISQHALPYWAEQPAARPMKVGDTVMVVKNETCHGHQIGSITTIVSMDPLKDPVDDTWVECSGAYKCPGSCYSDFAPVSPALVTLYNSLKS